MNGITGMIPMERTMKRVSIELARQLVNEGQWIKNPNPYGPEKIWRAAYYIHWRPLPLPEDMQFAIVEAL